MKKQFWVPAANSATLEIEKLKAGLNATWTAGDFGKIAQSFAGGAAEFVARLGLRNGMQVLDVACGTGNQSIPAARTGALVTGIDIAPNLLEQARKRAARENLRIQFDDADAENLPYADASFDAVISMFGAMFAPRPDRVAAQLVRVCRPGGLIAMANWTPDGFVGQLFKAVGRYVPPPADVPSPMLWGNEERVKMCFGGAVSKIRLSPRSIALEFPFGIRETIAYWREFYGPVRQAFAVLDAENQEALRRDLEKLWSEFNISRNGATRVMAEYLEVAATRSY